MALPPLVGASSTATRQALHLVAAHVLARARYDATGRFGLRVLAGGFGTPMFGEDERVLRVSRAALLDECRTPDGPRTRVLHLDGSTLAEVAAFAGVNLDEGFSVGHDTPALGAADARLQVDAAAAAALGAWLLAGTVAVDRAVAALADTGAPTVLQLWPEHFDAGLHVAVAGGRTNLGISAGDAFCAEPYAYVGPWTAGRPGDPSYWNAPFGAYLPASAVLEDPDPPTAFDRFLARGLSLLGPPTA